MDKVVHGTHMGFVMTKAMKTPKKLPPNSEELKESYDIVRMVPVNDWSMTTRGSKQVSVTDLGDKRDKFFSAINVHFEIGQLILY